MSGKCHPSLDDYTDRECSVSMERVVGTSLDSAVVLTTQEIDAFRESDAIPTIDGDLTAAETMNVFNVSASASIRPRSLDAFVYNCQRLPHISAHIRLWQIDKCGAIDPSAVVSHCDACSAVGQVNRLCARIECLTASIELMNWIGYQWQTLQTQRFYRSAETDCHW